MRYPEFLADGGTIGFVAPSFGCAWDPYKTAFENALSKFENKGFKTLPGPNAYASSGCGISNTPQLCGKEFTDFYTRSDTDVLISCGGGELMCEILPFVDFDAIKEAQPKWFMGYSDNTNLTYPLATICDTASFYGPCASTFGMEPWHPSIEDAFALLRGQKTEFEGYPKFEKESLKSEENPLATINDTEDKILTIFDGGKTDKATVRGRLIGGCVDCLVTLLGTRFDRTNEFIAKYKGDGILWFLESCDLNVFAVRRALWQMREAGWFEDCSGFVIGRPLAAAEELFGLDHITAFTEPLKDFGVPIILDADFGHVAPSLPIITGAVGTFEACGNDLKVKYEP